MVKIYEEEIKRLKEKKAKKLKKQKELSEYRKLKDEVEPSPLATIFNFIKELILNILRAFGIWKD